MMSLEDKMLTVAIYWTFDGLRVVHEACGGQILTDEEEVRLHPQLTQLVAAHRCVGP